MAVSQQLNNMSPHSPSSVSVLRSKASDLNRGGLSVTIVSTEPLPSYSSERFWLLSEIEMKAHPICFVCQENPSVPAFGILYLLWKPDVNATTFADIVLENVVKLERLIGPQEEAKIEQDHSLYIVVDRVNPTTVDSHQEEEELLAYDLAKHVASHPKLREACEGITIGVSNHERAAPGLAACVDAVALGSKDRRHHSGESKSLVGIVTDDRSSILGLDPTEADAVQGVQQKRITAEWNGRGNLKSFAWRAHSSWCRLNGLPPAQEYYERRKIPRRLSNGGAYIFLEEDDEEEGSEHRRRELFQDTLAGSVFILYLIFHFHHEIRWFAFLMLDPSLWDDFAQRLREL
jgi:hypothetical protein